MLLSRQQEAIHRNPEILQELELTVPCNPRALDIILEVFRGNIHGLFFPVLEEKKPSATFFTQKPQDWQEEEVRVGERQGGQGVKPEAAWATAPSWPNCPPCF